MRILLVLHDFLPAHPSGTEVYTGQLALALRERGHEVEIFATEKDVSRPHLRLDRRVWQGIVVHELVNNLFYDDFRETWDWPPAVAAFRRVLDGFRPDVVHVMHLLYLSLGVVEEACERGLPVFFTLHDFWLQCARFGQRIHADGSICHAIDFERCGTCLARLKFAQTPLQRGAARAVARVRSATGLDLAPLARGGAGLLGLHGRAKGAHEPAPERERAMARAMATRDEELRRRLVPSVERFLAPSRFLRERFVDWGIPAERIAHFPNGVDLERFGGVARTRADRVRVAFLGTLAPHKAPHLLVEAWSRLSADLRERASLTLYGPAHHFPDYVADLERAAAAAGARLAGPIASDDVPRALAQIDLLVVPSVWYENAPLSILEARATRTPLVVSDLGGMAELVEPGRDGWRFRPGDAADLAEKLARVIADPSLLRQLDFGGAPVKGMREVAQDAEALYRAALEP